MRTLGWSSRVPLVLFAVAAVTLPPRVQAQVQSPVPAPGPAAAAPAEDMTDDSGKLKPIRDINVPMTDEIRAKLDKMAQDVKAHPDDAVKLAEYGYRLTRVGKIEEGVGLLQRAAGMAPDEPKVLLFQARGLWKAGKLEEASDAAQRAGNSPLATPRDASEAFRVAGAARWELQDVVGAEKLLRQSVKVDPENASALSNLGSFLLSTKRRGEGIGVLAQAADKGSKDPKQLVTIARQLEGLGEYERSTQIWQRVAELVPDDPDVNFIVGSNYVRDKAWDKDAQHLERTLKRKPTDANAYVMYAQALLRLGRYDEAKRAAGMADKFGAGEAAQVVLHSIEMERAQ